MERRRGVVQSSMYLRKCGLPNAARPDSPLAGDKVFEVGDPLTPRLRDQLPRTLAHVAFEARFYRLRKVFRQGVALCLQVLLLHRPWYDVIPIHGGALTAVSTESGHV